MLLRTLFLGNTPVSERQTTQITDDATCTHTQTESIATHAKASPCLEHIRRLRSAVTSSRLPVYLSATRSVDVRLPSVMLLSRRGYHLIWMAPATFLFLQTRYKKDGAIPLFDSMYGPLGALTTLSSTSDQ